ncbi:hypothetical protein HDU82_005495 [Entophlyctis luteolus]|nr:hypothetical protein HDU82_005495 [Entophlyctis luteolus]
MIGGSSTLYLCLGLTIFRYNTIIRHYETSSTFAFRFVVIASLVSVVMSLLPFFLGSADVTYVLQRSRVYCCTDWTARDIKTQITIVANMLTIAPPIVFIVFAYSHIYLQMRRSVKDIRASHATLIPALNASPDPLAADETALNLCLITLLNEEEEHALRNMKQSALKKCDDVVVEYVKCIQHRTITGPIMCRTQLKAMNACVAQYTSEEALDELRMLKYKEKERRIAEAAEKFSASAV